MRSCADGGLQAKLALSLDGQHSHSHVTKTLQHACEIMNSLDRGNARTYHSSFTADAKVKKAQNTTRSEQSDKGKCFHCINKCEGFGDI